MSIRNNTPMLPTLQEGAHTAILLDYVYSVFTKPAVTTTVCQEGNLKLTKTTPATEIAESEFYKITLQLEDRITNDSLYNQQFGWAIQNIAKQLGNTKAYSPVIKAGKLVKTGYEVFMDELIANKTPFTVYTTNNVEYFNKNTGKLETQARKMTYYKAQPKFVVEQRPLTEDEEGIEI